MSLVQATFLSEAFLIENICVYIQKSKRKDRLVLYTVFRDPVGPSLDKTLFCRSVDRFCVRINQPGHETQCNRNQLVLSL